MTNQRKKQCDYWEFIEQYYPNYYTCDDILLSDILYRKLNCERICQEDENLIKEWDVKATLLILDQLILSKAVENYFKEIYS